MPLYSELNELKKFENEDFAILFKCPKCKEPIPRGALVANRDMCPNCAIEAFSLSIDASYGEPKVVNQSDLDRYLTRRTRALRRELRAQKSTTKALMKMILDMCKMTKETFLQECAKGFVKVPPVI